MPYDNPNDVAVGLLPVMQSGRILLAGIVRGKLGGDGQGKNALFGGYVDKGESIEQAMAREAVPEKNINLVLLSLRQHRRDRRPGWYADLR